jgi:hypothetical protein
LYSLVADAVEAAVAAMVVVEDVEEVGKYSR